ncbi:hypothetical protein LCGC14_2829240, partial [marine sediment metagenome]
PVVPPAKAIQAAAGPAAEALGGVDGGIQLEAIRLGLQGLEATLPRERTLDEAFEGGIVNPFAAIAGDKEEQDKAQAVLEEAGLLRALAAQVVFDPLNVLPGFGLTKFDDVARLGRLVLRATRAAPEARVAAVATLRESGQFQKLLRTVSDEAGGRPPAGPLRGGEARVFPDELTRENVIARGDPGPPPPDKPPTGGRPPEGPDDFNLADVRIGKEEAGETLIRRHQGAIDTAKRIAANEVRDNNQELVRIGLGRNFRGSVVAREEGAFNELNSLLHNPSKVASGELTVPDNLKDIYRTLRAQTDWEQAARIDFDPEMALVDDYFFRGWQPPEGMFTGEARGSLGRNPSFKLPRVDATYDEMFEAGFRPMFENPAEQARHSQLMGIKYREQSRLIAKMQASEM